MDYNYLENRKLEIIHNLLDCDPSNIHQELIRAQAQVDLIDELLMLKED